MVCNIVVFISLCLSLISQAQSINKGFVLNGTIAGTDRKIIYLRYFSDVLNHPTTDSAQIVAGHFTFAGLISNPTVAFISLDERRAMDSNATNIFLEPDTLTLHLKNKDFQSAQMRGSKTQYDYEHLRNESASYAKTYVTLYKMLQDEKLQNKTDSIESLMQALYDSIKQKEFEYFHRNPSSYLTAYLLQGRIRELSIDSLVLFYSRLGTKLQRNIVTEKIRERITQKKMGSVGSLAQPIIAKDISGNDIITALIKNKFILLSFWASWCVPCRKENPQLHSLLSKYKDKVMVIGISDDHDAKQWETAIEKDRIEGWVHILRKDGKEEITNATDIKNDIFRKFDVSTLPLLILINTDKMIVGRFQNLAELEQNIHKFF